MRRRQWFEDNGVTGVPFKRGERSDRFGNDWA